MRRVGRRLPRVEVATIAGVVSAPKVGLCLRQLLLTLLGQLPFPLLARLRGIPLTLSAPSLQHGAHEGDLPQDCPRLPSAATILDICCGGTHLVRRTLARGLCALIASGFSELLRAAQPLQRRLESRASHSRPVRSRLVLHRFFDQARSATHESTAPVPLNELGSGEAAILQQHGSGEATRSETHEGTAPVPLKQHCSGESPRLLLGPVELRVMRVMETPHAVLPAGGRSGSECRKPARHPLAISLDLQLAILLCALTAAPD